MTDRRALRPAELRTMADVASAKGCVVEIERDGVIYRVIPETLAQVEQRGASDIDSAPEFELD